MSLEHRPPLRALAQPAPQLGRPLTLARRPSCLEQRLLTAVLYGCVVSGLGGQGDPAGADYVDDHGLAVATDVHAGAGEGLVGAGRAQCLGALHALPGAALCGGRGAGGQVSGPVEGGVTGHLRGARRRARSGEEKKQVLLLFLRNSKNTLMLLQVIVLEEKNTQQVVTISATNL